MAQWKTYLAPAAAVVLLLPGAGYAVQYLSVQDAQRDCFPGAASFAFTPIIYSSAQIAAIEKQSGQKVNAKGLQVWEARSKDALLGYIVVDYVIGKHLAIDYAIAVSPDFTVTKVEVLQYRESYGGEIKNPDWLKQFAGKTADSPLELNNDIINISGATLSSRHVTEGVKRVLTTLHITHEGK
jgi:Na+-translocating ferredoxin:NAD+ oxidoreductase RnfG subunit